MTVPLIDTYANTVGNTLIYGFFTVPFKGKSPAADIAAFLGERMIGVIPDGTNDEDTVYIYETHEPSDKSLTVPTITVYDSGGFDSIIGEDFKNHQPTVQIIVASGQGDTDTASNKAYEIKRLMQEPFSLVAGNMKYYGSYVQGDVNFIGTDDNNVSRYSVNIRLYRAGGLTVSGPEIPIETRGGLSAAKDAVLYISEAGLAIIPTGTLVPSGVYIYQSQEPSSRSLVVPTVTVYDTGGFDNIIGEDFKNSQPTIQIVVAGAPAKTDDAYNKALEIKELMQSSVAFDVKRTDAPVAKGNRVFYYGSYAQGDINYQGTDENDVARYSIDIRLYRNER